jgi:hypothetical protein
MSEDVVNNPKHYNKQGIEVIEVIEAYTPDSPHLANVLKYVCRCEYKGKKLQDLKKASWYLDRAIVLLEAEEAEERGLTRDEVAEQFEGWVGIDRGVSDWTLDDIEPPTPEDVVDTLREAAEELLEEPHGYTDREVEVFWDGYEAKEQEIAEANAAEECLLGGKWRTGTQVITSPDRIAGDNEAAKRMKDEYYNFDRYEIVGYCANCDAEISATQPYLKSFDFDAGLKFCKQQCIDSLKAWQKDWKGE